jgi:fucose 4-O-acetylase-like acetyltransferase
MRRTDLDGLRILLCAAVIFQHALLIFASEPRYHLKSDEPSAIASVLYEFPRATTMAVFFVIAGWAAVTSLRRRSVVGFVKERVTRLLLPLLVGIATFGSVIKYIELVHGRDLGFHGLRPAKPLTEILGIEPPIGFFDFFPRNLKHLNWLTWSHLWFLAYLFLIALLLLPLLVQLARRTPVADVPPAYAVYLPALPMAALLVGVDGYWPYLPNLITDWGNFGYFALCFAIGGAIAAWPGFELRLRAEAPRLLALLLLAFAGVVLCGESVAGRLFVGLTAWGAIGAGLGYAARLAPVPTPALRYLGEATLPVYIVHHAPLLLIGVVVLPMPLPVWFKIVTIWVGATMVSFAAYHWLIRPWPPIRWLLGMSPRSAAVTVGAAVTPLA